MSRFEISLFNACDLVGLGPDPGASNIYGISVVFLKFVVPFDVRNDPFTYEWVVYRAVDNIKDLGLLMPPNYWSDVEARKTLNSWTVLPEIRKNFDYSLPDAADLERLPKFPLGYETLDEVRRKVVGPGLIWAYSIEHRIPALEAAVDKALDAAGPVEAVLAWTNCPSMKAAARQRGIATIHHELGPLRPPYFRFTAYLDFEGVNGHTDAARRWERFRSEEADVPVLSRSQLLELMSVAPPQPHGEVTHEVGVALQVPDDSNLLAFGQGFDSFEAISTARRYLPGSVLVRSHPQRGQFFSGLPVDWDESPHPAEFLDRVGSLVTINSSLAFEAMLLGKPTYVLGDSPVKVASWDIMTQTPAFPEEVMLRWLNWFVFAYLIPFELTFDAEYYRWRLTDPSEADIYLDNFRRWTHRG